MIYNTATPYIASYVIIRKNDKIAFILRANTAWMNGYYGLPAGKVEPNETFRAAAMREAQEEIGITINSEDLEPILVMHRKSDDRTNWVDTYFEGKKWAGEPVNAEPHKHSEMAWLSPDKLPKNVIPCVQYAMEQIALGNHYCEFGWSA